MLNFIVLMKGIGRIEKGISGVKKNRCLRKKILKVVWGQTITGLTAMKPTG